MSARVRERGRSNWVGEGRKGRGREQSMSVLGSLGDGPAVS